MFISLKQIQSFYGNKIVYWIFIRLSALEGNFFFILATSEVQSQTKN